MIWIVLLSVTLELICFVNRRAKKKTDEDRSDEIVILDHQRDRYSAGYKIGNMNKPDQSFYFTRDTICQLAELHCHNGEVKAKCGIYLWVYPKIQDFCFGHMNCSN